jgi:hypothetical protein
MAIIPAVFIFSACSPQATPSPAGPDLQATVAALETQVAQGGQSAGSPTPEPQVKPSPTPGEIQSDYAGFMVFVDQKFVGLDFNGKPLGFSVDAPGVEGLSLYDASVFNLGVMHAYAPEMKIRLVTAAGIKTLDYISMDQPVQAIISADGSKVAWAIQFYGGDAPGSELYTANLDGSDSRLVDQIRPEDNADRWLTLRPLEWTRDGRLLYATRLTGIGGYILYPGWNSLRLYDPADGGLTVLVEDNPAGMCIHSLSADRTLAALGCKEIRIRKLADGNEVSLPALDLQNVAGSARFSPSGAWVAYATALSNPDNERSQVVVAASDGSGEPQPIQTMEGGDFHVLGWINEDSFLFSAHTTIENVTTIWRIDRDGSRPTMLIEAQFLGFIPAQ